MEDYNRIIESLSVRFIKAKNLKILKPIAIENLYEVENTILYIHKGSVQVNTEQITAEEGDMLLIPGGKMISITYGQGEPIWLKNEDFASRREVFFESYINEDGQEEIEQNHFSSVTFEAKVFDSVNFFSSLDISPFILKKDDEVYHLFDKIVREVDTKTAGQERSIKLLTDLLVVEIIRYLIRNRMFVEQFATNSSYFKDPRLIDIFAYIKENISGDLSNKVLANVANVSEDYVGQYFKMLTGINPQDYIEYQRMERAVNLLRTSKRSIREIGTDVGYKDTAYFCRRFKMMFGIPAGKMRRRESLMDL